MNDIARIVEAVEKARQERQEAFLAQLEPLTEGAATGLPVAAETLDLLLERLGMEPATWAKQVEARRSELLADASEAAGGLPEAERAWQQAVAAVEGQLASDRAEVKALRSEGAESERFVGDLRARQELRRRPLLEAKRRAGSRFATAREAASLLERLSEEVAA